MSVIKLSDNVCVGHINPVFIIAEIGQNHQGSLNTAKQLILAAKNAGADCVKFQKTCLNEKFNKAALNRPYNNPNSFGSTYGEHKNFLEFSDDQFMELQKYSTECDILFSASAMDSISLKLLRDMKLPFIKIGSGDANNFLLIKQAASTRIPLIISTGMQNFDAVKSIYETVSQYHKNFCLLHCVSTYPSPPEEVNLDVIKLYEQEFTDIPVGYSGHEIGFDISVAAVALGAKVIERHITLDRSQKGSDHVCSLDPLDFKSMVKQIRNVEIFLGSAVKQIQPSEYLCYQKLGKTVVVSRSLKKGHKLCEDDLKIKVAEPKGIDGSHIKKIIGKIINKNLEEDDSLTAYCLE